MKLRVISGRDVRELLPIEDCMPAVADALRELSAGRTCMPLRSKMAVPGSDQLMALMPASMETPAVLGVKVLSIGPRPPGDPRPSHLGGVLLFDRPAGEPLALVDAATITEIRTAATSAVATKLLARPDSKVLAIVGTGAQARAHALALRVVSPLREVRIWGREASRALALRDSLRQSAGSELRIEVADTVMDAVGSADVVCTATASRAPVLEGQWIAPGTHINAVGAAVPGYRELDTPLVVRSRVFVDRRESAEAEADDLRTPLAEGAISADHIVGELGDVLLGRTPGRQSPEQVTLFKSVGVAVEDLASAFLVYQRAVARGMGNEVEI